MEKSKHKRVQAFTLIEILVALTIIGASYGMINCINADMIGLFSCWISTTG